jgi:hypothetical protein
MDSIASRFLVALNTFNEPVHSSGLLDSLFISVNSIYTTFGESVGFLSAGASSASLTPYRPKHRHTASLSAVALPSQGIQFTIGPLRTTSATIDLFDLRGRRIQAITVPLNVTRMVWNSSCLAPGIYLAYLRGNARVNAVRIHRQ